MYPIVSAEQKALMVGLCLCVQVLKNALFMR